MRRESILLSVVAALLVGAAIYSALRPKESDATSPARRGTHNGTAGGPAPAGAGADWRPETQAGTPVTGGEDGAGDTAGETAPLPQLPDVSDEGTLVAPGAARTVPLLWVRGEKNKFKYEVVQTATSTNMEDNGTMLMRETQRLSVEVLAGDGKGPSKVRVTIDSFRVQFPRANGLPLDFDSLVGDEGLMRDPGFRRLAEPRIAVIGRPLDFHIDVDGRIIDIDGADDFRDRYLDAADRVTPGQARRAPDVPTRATLSALWESLLFPRLGAGDIEAGKGRRFTCRYHVPGGWAVIWNGKVDAYKETADAIRFEGVATPSPVQDDTAPPSETPVAKVNALGDYNAMQAAWWFSKKHGGLIEARVRAKYQIHISYQAGSNADGSAAYAPKFHIVDRHLLIRRTSEE